MKHRVKAKHLNRDTNSRKALFKSLATSLIESGEIETTEAKAKAVKGLVDKLIHKAQEGSISTRRLLARFFGRRDVVNQLVDEVAPAMKDRTSGFTRITKIANRRGDNAEMVKIELVEKPVISDKKEKVAEEEKKQEPKKIKADKKEAPKKSAKKAVKSKTE